MSLANDHGFPSRRTEDAYTVHRHLLHLVHASASDLRDMKHTKFGAMKNAQEIVDSNSSFLCAPHTFQLFRKAINAQLCVDQLFYDIFSALD